MHILLSLAGIESLLSKNELDMTEESVVPFCRSNKKNILILNV